jgi:protein O-mannosyl-transferase
LVAPAIGKTGGVVKSPQPPWLFPGILVLVVAALNLNTLRNGFTYDDRTLAGVPWPSVAQAGRIFQSTNFPGPAGNYEPPAGFSLVLNRAATGLNASGFHGVNVALHLLATLMVFGFSTVVLKGRPAGFLAALLFAVHPVHTEVFQKLEGRGILMASAALIAALWLSLRKNGRRNSALEAAGFLVLYVIALLCSSGSVFFPGLWLLTVVLLEHSGGSFTGRVKLLARDVRFWGLLAATFAYWGIKHTLLPDEAAGFIDNPLTYTGLIPRILTSVDVIRRYLVLLAWPYRLSPDYSYNTVPVLSTVGSLQLFLGISVLVVLIAAAVAAGKRRNLYLFAFLFFLVSIAPYSNLFFPARIILAERFLYLPSLAICLALVQFFVDSRWMPSDAAAPGVPIARQFKPMVVVFVCILAPWAAQTYLRNAEWANDWSLYRAAARITPETARAHFVLGGVYFSRADDFGAERQFYQALQIYPDYIEAAIRLAGVYVRLDRSAKALDLLNSFSGRAGDFEGARLREIARVYSSNGEFQRAAEMYEQALRLNDNDTEAHRELGILYSQYLNMPERGRAHTERGTEPRK